MEGGREGGSEIERGSHSQYLLVLIFQYMMLRTGMKVGTALSLK